MRSRTSQVSSLHEPQMSCRRQLGTAFALLACLASAAQGQFGPFVQDGKLQASDSSAIYQLGTAVAVSGDTVVIGSQYDEAAYVFVRDGSGWVQQAKLTAPDASPSSDKQFGITVAISGDIIAIGAPNDSPGPPPGVSSAGSAYVFMRIGPTWSLLSKYEGMTKDEFYGSAVAMSGTTLAISAPLDDIAGKDRGSVRLFTWNGTAFQFEAILTAAAQVPSLGKRGLAVADDVVVVGADTLQNPNTLVVVVFEKAEGVWGQSAVLGESIASSAFGARSIAASEARIIVGNSFSQFTDAAYSYVKVGGQWTLETALNPSALSTPEGFAVVALQADRAIVGWHWDFDGAAYLFLREGTTWSEWGEIVAAAPWQDDGYAYSVASDDEYFVIGARYLPNPGFGAQGGAYVFRNQAIGAWTSLGYGIPGSAGQAALTANGYLQSGSPVSLVLGHARPFSLAPLVVGITSIAAQFKGGVMVPNPDFIFLAFTDFNGASAFGGLWPSGVPSGFTTYFQWWIQDPLGPKGFAASNALVGTTP